MIVRSIIKSVSVGPLITFPLLHKASDRMKWLGLYGYSFGILTGVLGYLCKAEVSGVIPNTDHPGSTHIYLREMYGHRTIGRALAFICCAGEILIIVPVDAAILYVAASLQLGDNYLMLLMMVIGSVCVRRQWYVTVLAEAILIVVFAVLVYYQSSGDIIASDDLGSSVMLSSSESFTQIVITILTTSGLGLWDLKPLDILSSYGELSQNQTSISLAYVMSSIISGILLVGKCFFLVNAFPTYSWKWGYPLDYITAMCLCVVSSSGWDTAHQGALSCSSMGYIGRSVGGNSLVFQIVIVMLIVTGSSCDSINVLISCSVGVQILTSSIPVSFSVVVFRFFHPEVFRPFVVLFNPVVPLLSSTFFLLVFLSTPTVLSEWPVFEFCLLSYFLLILFFLVFAFSRGYWPSSDPVKEKKWRKCDAHERLYSSVLAPGLLI